MARSSSLKPIIYAAIAALVVVIAIPTNWKSSLPSILRPDFHLGLDLAGGTQLDFRISEDEIRAQLEKLNTDIAAAEAGSGGADELTALRNQKLALEDQQTNLIEAIRTVLEKRINSLGVSEATITPS